MDSFDSLFAQHAAIWADTYIGVSPRIPHRLPPTREGLLEFFRSPRSVTLSNVGLTSSHTVEELTVRSLHLLSPGPAALSQLTKIFSNVPLPAEAADLLAERFISEGAGGILFANADYEKGSAYSPVTGWPEDSFFGYMNTQMIRFILTIENE
jgi:hypothetical protein